ncbi:MAG: pyridoxamine 5'-phosphate oxidase family protein [Deltaproteobacteria bacterium]|nr:pyridoxamine 5'-phosphate oxidase family protein [Deltaproteobacteria bacterium]
MGISEVIALTSEQMEQILLTEWNMRIATVGPGKRINLTPMWFGWAGGKIYTHGRGQKVINLRQNPNCTVLIDRNEKFPELQGLMMLGRATVLEDAAAEKANLHLSEVQKQMGVKYNGGHGKPPVADPQPLVATASGSTRRWIVFTPETVVTWDNFKLKGGERQ